MAKKLNTNVHAVERNDAGEVTNSGIFGPNDDLPEWVEGAVTNPDVWDDDSDDDGPVEDATRSDSLPAEGTDLEVPPPAPNPADPTVPPADPATGGETAAPRGNAGRDEWAAYATEQGVPVTDDMTRNDIKAAVEARTQQ